MTPLRQRLIEDIRLRNFSQHTVEAYVRAVAHFARHFGRSPDQLTSEQVRQYLLYRVQERKVSWSLYNQTRCALQFFYRVMMPRRRTLLLIPIDRVSAASISLRALDRTRPRRPARRLNRGVGLLGLLQSQAGIGGHARRLHSPDRPLPLHARTPA